MSLSQPAFDDDSWPWVAQYGQATRWLGLRSPGVTAAVSGAGRFLTQPLTPGLDGPVRAGRGR